MPPEPLSDVERLQRQLQNLGFELIQTNLDMLKLMEMRPPEDSLKLSITKRIDRLRAIVLRK